jgi:hypothetical protein
MTESGLREGDAIAAYRRLVGRIPQRRPAEPTEQASVILFPWRRKKPHSSMGRPSLSMAGSTIPLLLTRRGQPLRGLRVTARGQRRDEHTSVFTRIEVEFVLHGDNLDPEIVEHCITLADEKLCPVWAMLRPATPIVTKYRIEG